MRLPRKTHLTGESAGHAYGIAREGGETVGHPSFLFWGGGGAGKQRTTAPSILEQRGLYAT